MGFIKKIEVCQELSFLLEFELFAFANGLSLLKCRNKRRTLVYFTTVFAKDHELDEPICVV